MFLICMSTAIISLLWSVQLFVVMPPTAVTFWLNIVMCVQWPCLCYVFCQKQLSTNRRSPLLEFLIQV